ncbi:MAG: hypothetical protein M4579_007316 [Chaenotheca gracillima]|nr:MAG: hypothetical protein M4579_007316 [Chaenotheca gracillima]
MHIGDNVTVISEVDVEIIATGSGAHVEFDMQPIEKLVPTALWDPYDPTTDPSSGSPITTLLDPSNATKPQLMGLTLTTPTPTFSTDEIPSLDIAAVFIDPDPASAPLPTNEHIPHFTSFAAQFPAAPAATVQATWAKPAYQMADLLVSWAAYAGAKKGDSLMGRLMELGETTESPPMGLFEQWGSCYVVPPVIAVGGS